MNGEQHGTGNTATEQAAAIPSGLPAGTRLELVAPAGGLRLLVPASPAAGDELLPRLQAWVEQGDVTVQAVVLELYGTLVIWTPQRSAVAAPVDRLQKAATAAAEFTETAAELAAIEQSIAAAWPAFEADLPSGFGITTAAAGQAEALAGRYHQSMSLAGRLARLSPRIHQPLLHPPTLASQIGERLRDRCRLADREEFADDQLETIIRLYEACGQRVSDGRLAQREHVLTWVIVLLLAAETLLLLVDLLAATGG